MIAVFRFAGLKTLQDKMHLTQIERGDQNWQEYDVPLINGWSKRAATGLHAIFPDRYRGVKFFFFFLYSNNAFIIILIVSQMVFSNQKEDSI